MVRDTSIDAYNYIRENRFLGQRQWDVYHALTKFGPCTASELHKRMKLYRIGAQSNDNVCTRLGELRDMKVVVELEKKRQCKVTGFNVIVWDINSNKYPKKLERRESASQKLKNLELEIQKAPMVYSSVENNDLWTKSFNRMNHKYRAKLVLIEEV